MLWMVRARQWPGLGQLVDKISPNLHSSLAGGKENRGMAPMMDYGELLRYLADHPPGNTTERCVHASMLELIATCIRDEQVDEVTDPSIALAQLRARYDGATEPCQPAH